MTRSFATLTFERTVPVPPRVLWEVWTAPAARRVWASPLPTVTVDVLEADTRVGGREVSLCKVAGKPDIRCETTWLEIRHETQTVNAEVVSASGETRSAALVTAEFREAGTGCQLIATVQVSGRSETVEADYREGFNGGLDHLADVAERTMVLRRVIAAPRERVWGAWANGETLPLWWGPDGFSCRTSRIDLRTGGEWVFDMIGPDGTIYPNHHRYGEVRAPERLSYTLLWGENGPKHADAWASFTEEAEGTVVTLGMVFGSVDEFRQARAFGAEDLGLQTLGKLARFAGAV